MHIAGFQKQSLIDYPGNISSVIFTQGCNFRCGYCHNPTLVLPEYFEANINPNEILTYIKKYQNLLNAVVVTGGEPTIHHDLPEFITKLKELGLKVKLDTNGTNPHVLRKLIDAKLIDFVAMDIKHILSLKQYNKSVGNILTKEIFQKVFYSIAMIKQSGLEHEFRTTIVKGLHTIDEIRSLKLQFSPNYKIQNYKPGKTLNPQSLFASFPDEELKLMDQICSITY